MYKFLLFFNYYFIFTYIFLCQDSDGSAVTARMGAVEFVANSISPEAASALRAAAGESSSSGASVLAALSLGDEVGTRYRKIF